MIVWEYHADFKWPENIDQARVEQWIRQCLEQKGRMDELISINFVDKEQMREINRRVFGRNYDTDTITLAYCEPEQKQVSADIYLSFPQIFENARQLNIEPKNELLRVLIHSILHATGMNDGTETEKQQMRAAENECLTVFS